jgi:hypothetical protein
MGGSKVHWGVMEWALSCRGLRTGGRSRERASVCDAFGLAMKRCVGTLSIFFFFCFFFLGPAAIRPGDFEPSSRERRGSLCAGSFDCFIPHSGSARRNKLARFQETDWVVERSRCRNQCRQVVCGSFASQVCSNHLAMLAMMAATILYTATASRGPPLFANAAQTPCTILGSTR